MVADKNQVTIERYGWVIKEEPLSVLNDPNLDLSINILESTAPFFGYYADEPHGDKPEHLYWVLDQFYPQEFLFRAINNVRVKGYPNIDATPGFILVANENYHVIRIHNLKRYNQVRTVQELLEEAGIKLRKPARRIINQMGIIHLCKFLQLIPLEEGLFGGAETPHSGYFTLPRYVSWDEFKEITREIKFDTTLMFFDAARAAFLENNKFTELVRVYRENLTIDQLKLIRDRYMKVMELRY